MKIKNFRGKKVIIQKFSKKHLKKVKEFQEFINSLVEEDAPILIDKKISLKEEKDWVNSKLNLIKGKKEVFLIAESEGKIIGSTHVSIGIGRQKHVGELGISVAKKYRRIGLGKYLIKEIIKLSKKELIFKPKVIRLSVISANKPAIIFYKKMGFKEVAEIPKQLQYKGKLSGEKIMILYL